MIECRMQNIEYRKQHRTCRITVIFLLFTVYCLLSTVYCYAQQGFYLGYKLSFYNLFSPGFHCFRRNHQFIFGYQNLKLDSSVINFEAQYNWIDEVKENVSTHNLTCWVISLKGIFNQLSGAGELPSVYSGAGQDEACLKYIYFINLLSPWLNRTVLGLEYQRLFAYNEFFGIARAGIGFSRKLLPIYGIKAVYLPNLNTNINFKFNWLEGNEDNPEFQFKFPLALGVGGRFTSQGSYNIYNIGEGIGFEYVWDPARSHLVSTPEGKLTHHWLKGYIGDRFWF